MAEQILSQEEIDALLNAMDSGEVDLDKESDKKEEYEVKGYDLTAQALTLRDQFDALDEVYDKFVNILNSSLTSSLQRTIGVKLASKEIVKFGEFLQAFANPTGFAIYSMEPLIGSAMMALEPKLAFSLIDCMFGGDGKPLSKIREFTEIEKHMLEKIYQLVLHDLELAWKVAYSVKIGIKKTETKPEFVNLVGPSDLVLTFVFEISGEQFSGNIHICTPYLMLEPIKDKLSSRYLREKDRAHVFRHQLTKLLKDTSLNMVAELGKTTCSIRDILELEVGDVIKLPTGPKEPVVINVEKVPKYVGMPGVVNGSKAVKITGLIHNNEGE